MGAGRKRFQRVPSFHEAVVHVQFVDISGAPASSALRSAWRWRWQNLFDVLAARLA